MISKHSDEYSPSVGALPMMRMQPSWPFMASTCLAGSISRSFGMKSLSPVFLIILVTSTLGMISAMWAFLNLCEYPVVDSDSISDPSKAIILRYDPRWFTWIVTRRKRYPRYVFYIGRTCVAAYIHYTCLCALEMIYIYDRKWILVGLHISGRLTMWDIPFLPYWSSSSRWEFKTNHSWDG